jgi:hypothetical protein
MRQSILIALGLMLLLSRQDAAHGEPPISMDEIQKTVQDCRSNPNSHCMCPRQPILQLSCAKQCGDLPKGVDVEANEKYTACMQQCFRYQQAIDTYNEIFNHCQAALSGDSNSPNVSTRLNNARIRAQTYPAVRAQYHQNVLDKQKMESQRLQEQARRNAAAAEARRIPAGWITCSCPEAHANLLSGKWVDGVFYHPAGPGCP